MPANAATSFSATMGTITVALLGQAADTHPDPWSEVDHAVTVLRATGDNDVHGVVHFLEVPEGIRVIADVSGLEPNQHHAFHIHQYGDMTKPDATSAGSHYDPHDTNHHARPNADKPHHAGDMGNLEADAQGNATYDRVIRGITIAGSESPILGRAVIIHAGADQFDQPTGSAGARIAFGCIGVANPESTPNLRDRRSDTRRDGTR